MSKDLRSLGKEVKYIGFGQRKNDAIKDLRRKEAEEVKKEVKKEQWRK